VLVFQLFIIVLYIIDVHFLGYIIVKFYDFKWY